MRTTVTIDDDLAIRLEQEQINQRKTFKEYLNEVIRAGLAAQREKPRQRPFRTKTLKTGRALIGNFDNIGEVLAIRESETYR